MKFLKPLVFLSVIFLSFTACKKDSDKPAPTLQGKWTGKYGMGNDNPAHFYSLNFKAGGVLEEINQAGEVRGTGTWEIDNNNIITGTTVNTKDPVGVKFSIIASFYPSDGIVLGNWGYDDSATDGGTFELKSKN